MIITVVQKTITNNVVNKQTIATISNATGPQGIPGPVGANGAAGAQGPQGPAGANGVGIIAGGATNQVLAKNSNADYDMKWITPVVAGGVPAGGTIGQILAKNSATDYDAVWTQTLAASLTAPRFFVTSSTASGACIFAPAADTIAISNSGIDHFRVAPAGIITMGSSVENSSLTINTKVNGGLTLSTTNTLGPGFTMSQSSQTSYQFFNNNGAFGVWNATLGITPFSLSGGTAAKVTTVAGGIFGFSVDTTNARVAADTAISRVSAGVFAFGTGAALNTGADIQANNFKAMQAGAGYFVKEGANAKMGGATLIAGTVTVANTAVNANSRIFLSRAAAGGTLGHLSYTQINGVSFTITSTSNTETSTINWEIMEAA